MTPLALHALYAHRRTPAPWVRNLGPVQERDVGTFVAEPTLVYDQRTRNLVLAYLPFGEDASDLVAGLRRLDWAWHERTSGLKARSKTFGFYPRNSWRQPRCGITPFARDEPELHARLVGLAPTIARLYAAVEPALYARQERLARGVRAEWLLAGTPYTGGIANFNCPYTYHRDSGNFAGVWSGMVAFREGITGGRLLVPEYDLALAIDDHTLTLFDGQALLHGVSPYTQERGSSYRITLVYYSQARMGDCLPLAQEVERAERLRRSWHSGRTPPNDA